MINVFVVYNSTHLLQVAEVRKKFKLSKEGSYLLVLGNKRHLYKSLRETVDSNDWEHVFFLYRNYDFTFDGIKFIADKFKRPVKNLLGHFRYKRFLKLLGKSGEINRIVASNFPSNDYFNRKFLSNTSCEELIHYDDGTASLIVMDKMSYSNEHKQWYLGKVKLPESMTFFTSYALTMKRSEDKVVGNDFSLFKEVIVSSSVNHEIAYFIGGNIYAYYTTFEAYLNMLERIRAFFESKGVKEVIYIAHRNESQESLDRISEILDVQNHTKSFETLLIEETENRPGRIASFFSSALTTSSIIFNHLSEMEFYSFKMDETKKGLKNQYLVDALYKDFEMNKLNDIKTIKDY